MSLPLDAVGPSALCDCDISSLFLLFDFRYQILADAWGMTEFAVFIIFHGVSYSVIHGSEIEVTYRYIGPGAYNHN